MRLSVLRKEQKLTVSVASDKAKYQPGETAAYTVTTRDYLGRAVPAELSLGVVDACIYALAPDATADPESVFYPDQEVRVQTEFSFAAQYSGGAFQTVPSRPRRGYAGHSSAPDHPRSPPVCRHGLLEPVRRHRRRRHGPRLVPDAGQPDDLAGDRARASRRAPPSAARRPRPSSTMPLLVRLALPRFYVQGDQAVVSAIVQNYSGAARTVHVTIEPHGATLTGEATRTVQLAAGGQERLDWRATVRNPSAQPPPLLGKGEPEKFPKAPP